MRLSALCIVRRLDGQLIRKNLPLLPSGQKLIEKLKKEEQSCE